MSINRELNVETVRVNGMTMYKVENQLFLKKLDAQHYANRRNKYDDMVDVICANDFRTKPANYDALSFGYSEISDDDFLRMLKNGKIRGMML